MFSERENLRIGLGMDVWTVCEQRDGKLNRVSLNIISEGRRLADSFGGESCGILMGSNARELANELNAYGVDRLYLLINDLLDNCNTEACTIALTELIRKEKPDLVLFGATRVGKEISARVAFRLGSPYISDCVIIRKDKAGDLKFTRTIFDKRLYSTVKTLRATTRIVSVIPEEAEIQESNKPRQTSLIEFSTQIKPENIRARSVAYIKGDPRNVDIREAEIIVAAGRGMGSADNLKTLYEFADLIGGNVAGTRAAVDAKWLPFERLVGQTGKTVRPKLYIACGISGAIQHRFGMKDSDTIIAINTDETAPIFKIAHLKIRGDVLELLPTLNRHLKEYLGS